jgi:hypothetical protein
MDSDGSKATITIHHSRFRGYDVLPHAAQLVEAAWHEGVAMGDVF